MRSKLFVLAALLGGACAHKDQIKATTPPPAPAASEEKAPAPVAETPKPVAAPETPAPSTPIYFGFDEATLSQDASGELSQIGDWLTKHGAAQVTISGHTDERGTTEYNLALGDRRAQAAREYLQRLGIDGARIKTVSYGKERPAAQGHDESSWSKNRRDEFEVMSGSAASR